MRHNRGICAGMLASTVMAASSAHADDDFERGLLVLGQSGEVASDQDVDAAIVIGGDLTVAGQVDGVAVAIGGDVRIVENARVDGAAGSIGGTLHIDDKARVEGPQVQIAAGDFSEVMAGLAEAGGAYEAPSPWLGAVMRVFQVLSLFIMAVFLLLLAPRQVRTVRQTFLHQPAQVTLAGIAVLFGFIPLCVLLGVSVVGIPLISVSVVLLLAMFVMGLTGLAVTVGFKLPVVRGEDNLFGAMTAGLLLLLLASAIPVLGAMVLFVASFYGAGAVVVSRFGTRPPPGGTPQPAPRTSSSAAAAEG